MKVAVIGATGKAGRLIAREARSHGYEVTAITRPASIGKLEEDGYLKREVDPEDKRATLLSLSELGQARISELQDERSDRLNQLFGNLSQEEKEQLSLLLAKILPERKCHRHHPHEVREEQ